MIARLKGKIIHIKPTELILDVHDIGFELTIPFSTYQKIHEDKEGKGLQLGHEAGTITIRVYPSG